MYIIGKKKCNLTKYATFGHLILRNYLSKRNLQSSITAQRCTLFQANLYLAFYGLNQWFIPLGLGIEIRQWQCGDKKKVLYSNVGNQDSKEISCLQVDLTSNREKNIQSFT